MWKQRDCDKINFREIQQAKLQRALSVHVIFARSPAICLFQGVSSSWQQSTSRKSFKVTQVGQIIVRMSAKTVAGKLFPVPATLGVSELEKVQMGGALL